MFKIADWRLETVTVAEIVQWEVERLSLLPCPGQSPSDVITGDNQPSPATGLSKQPLHHAGPCLECLPARAGTH